MLKILQNKQLHQGDVRAKFSFFLSRTLIALWSAVITLGSCGVDAPQPKGSVSDETPSSTPAPKHRPAPPSEPTIAPSPAEPDESKVSEPIDDALLSPTTDAGVELLEKSAIGDAGTGIAKIPPVGDSGEESPAADAGADTSKQLPGDEDGIYFVPSHGPQNRGGLVHLDATGRWRTIRSIGHRLTTAPDGRMYMVTRDYNDNYGIASVADGKFLWVEPSISWVLGIIAQGDNKFWAIGLKGIAFYDGKAWKVLPSKNSLVRNRLYPKLITQDPNGVIWVTNGKELYRVVGQALELVVLPELENKYILAFVKGSDGSLFLCYDVSVLRWRDGTWKPFELTFPEQSERAHMHRLTSRADGTVAVYLPSPRALGFLKPDGTTSTLPLKREAMVTSIAADTAGRFWVATDVGLFVVQADLSNFLRFYPRGSIDAFQRPKKEGYGVDAILARGRPFKLPMAQKPRGWVRGVLTQNGVPLPGVRLEICEDPIRGSLGSAGSPCEFSEVGTYASGDKTRSDGSFRLFDVPYRKLFDFAVYVDKHWHVSRSSPCCLGMRQEGIYDMGTLEVNRMRRNK